VPGPLPVTVLTGFLGAGKTSLLLRLLGQPHDARVAVIINEVGLAGTEALEVDEASFLELSQGCVCCVRADDLRGALEALAARGDLDRVVVETTGIADPLALTFVLERPDLAELCRLDAVVTVVDAASWRQTQVPEWDAQVGAADLIVVAKTDLAPADDALRAALAAVNPAARVLDGAGELPLELLLDVERRAPARAPAGAHQPSFTAVSMAGPTLHDRDRLEDLLEALPASVFRAKGVARTESGWVAFHVVGGRAQVEPCAAPGHGETRAVFLGPRLDEPALRAAFAATARLA
jgi:G3E family GTPase